MYFCSAQPGCFSTGSSLQLEHENFSERYFLFSFLNVKSKQSCILFSVVFCLIVVLLLLMLSWISVVCEKCLSVLCSAQKEASSFSQYRLLMAFVCFPQTSSLQGCGCTVWLDMLSYTQCLCFTLHVPSHLPVLSHVFVTCFLIRYFRKSLLTWAKTDLVLPHPINKPGWILHL